MQHIFIINLPDDSEIFLQELRERESNAITAIYYCFFNSKYNAVHARALVHMIPKKPFGIDKYKFQLCMDLF